MVAPTAFTFNEQTAQDNHFMHAINNGPEVRCSMRLNTLAAV